MALSAGIEPHQVKTCWEETGDW